MEIVDLGVLSNSNKESFQKKTSQHLRIVPIADFFVRLCPTNKSPILTSDFDPCCKSKSACI
jgi:hypothetical protein